MEYRREGTQCFHCSRLADCKKVSPSVSSCKNYIQSYITRKEIAKILHCAVRTVERRLKNNRKKTIKEIEKKINAKLIVETYADGRSGFWRKDSGT